MTVKHQYYREARQLSIFKTWFKIMKGAGGGGNASVPWSSGTPFSFGTIMKIEIRIANNHTFNPTLYFTYRILFGQESGRLSVTF